MALNINNESGNILNVTLPSGTIPVSLNINTNSSWVYTNFPENIDSESMLGDKGNARLNRQTVNTGNVQVFYSHYNLLKANLRYGIRIYNPNSSSVTITPLNCGHSDALKGWEDSCGGSWARFFNGIGDCDIKSAKTISGYGELWIMDKLITRTGFFSGNLRFSTTAPVAVSTYAYYSRSAVGDNTTTYSYDSAPSNKKLQYSGLGEGFFFTADKITLNASELLGDGKHFKTHYSSYSPSTLMKVNGQTKSDMIPIHLAGSSSIAGAGNPNPYHNVGNWCAHYYIPIRLYNDTNRNVIFNGYVQTGNSNANTFILSSGSTTKYGKVGKDHAGDSWRWLTTNPITPKNAVDDVYQFILGTNSSKYVHHIWNSQYA